jgi:hypothetical protein
MKTVTKKELIDSVDRTQESGAETVGNPAELDFLGKFIKSSIDDAKTVSSVVDDIDYAIDQLQKAKSELSNSFDKKQVVV